MSRYVVRRMRRGGSDILERKRVVRMSISIDENMREKMVELSNTLYDHLVSLSLIANYLLRIGLKVVELKRQGYVVKAYKDGEEEITF